MDKIILVEDDLLLRDLYTTILRQEGFNVIAAEDGEAALAIIEKNRDAKLILTDILLPKVHGIDLIKQLKSSPATQDLPVVILTNLTDDGVVKEAMRLGAKGYLTKVQFTPQELVSKIKELISTNSQA